MLAPTLQTASTAAHTTAEVSGKAANAIESSVGWFLSWPSEWPGLRHLLESCEHLSGGTSTLLIVGGVVLLVYGEWLHKWVVAINCAILGAWAGGMLGKHWGATVPGLLTGAALAALAAWPLIRFSIQLVAAGVGFVVGCCTWLTFPHLSPEYAWAGGAIGTTFLFMLAHNSVKWAVLLATGFEGAALLIAGVLGWLFEIGSVRGNLDDFIRSPYTLPVAILLPTFLGLMYQHRSGGGIASGEGQQPAAQPARR